MICEFSNPVNYLGDPASEGEIWNFKTSTCLERFELIENSTTGAEFFIDKTINYGEILLLFFVSIFLISIIFKMTWNFICPRDKKL